MVRCEVSKPIYPAVLQILFVNLYLNLWLIGYLSKDFNCHHLEENEDGTHNITDLRYLSLRLSNYPLGRHCHIFTVFLTGLTMAFIVPSITKTSIGHRTAFHFVLCQEGIMGTLVFPNIGRRSSHAYVSLAGIAQLI